MAALCMGVLTQVRGSLLRAIPHTLHCGTIECGKKQKTIVTSPPQCESSAVSSGALYMHILTLAILVQYTAMAALCMGLLTKARGSLLRAK